MRSSRGSRDCLPLCSNEVNASLYVAVTVERWSRRVWGLSCSHFEGVQEYNGEDYFYFSYRISITNNGPDIIRLKTRHWEILDGNNQREIVECVPPLPL